MWNFLRPGCSGAAAVADLEQLIRDLTKTADCLPADQVVAANSYLIWTEEAERRLLSTFQSFTVPRLLHSDRYWRIRSMSSSTTRPQPLIRAEIKIQEKYLEGLLAQLKHYMHRVCLPSDHWIIVPDTNVYIHGRLVQEVEWHRELQLSQERIAKRTTIVMPLVILDELDRIKDRDPRFGRRAATVLKFLDNLTRGADWLSPTQLRSRVWLQLTDEPFGHERQRGHDDEIVRQAAYFSQLNEGRLVILTCDRGMRVRAQTFGLANMILPKHLKRTENRHD